MPNEPELPPTVQQLQAALVALQKELQEARQAGAGEKDKAAQEIGKLTKEIQELKVELEKARARMISSNEGWSLI